MHDYDMIPPGPPAPPEAGPGSPDYERALAEAKQDRAEEERALAWLAEEAPPDEQAAVWAAVARAEEGRAFLGETHRRYWRSVELAAQAVGAWRRARGGV